MNVVIIKYNAGNTRSVQFALERMGVHAKITDDKELIKSAHKVIFPGVGNATTAMTYLKERDLDKVIKELEQPVLGICLGLQLLCQHTEEGDQDCLGIFEARVKRFVADGKHKVPHTGWNQVYKNSGTIMKNIPEHSDLYFVHSFYAEECKETGGSTNYIHPFSAVLERNNFYAAQFHIEKSGTVGETILKNFINL
ncbi:MAG: imidazole glycerol phosphate synthase subunit HisH [Chitinophagaceae bacterium]